MHRLVERFLEMLVAERGASLATVEAYKRDLEHWIHFIGEVPERASRRDVEVFAEQMSKDGLAPTTASRRLSALRQFYKFLLSEQLITESPTNLVESPKHFKPLPKTLSEKDVDALLVAAQQWPDKEGLRISAMLEILYASGLRVSELVSLPLADVRRALNMIRPSLVIKGKGGKERVVLLNQKALESIKAYMNVRSEFLSAKKESPYFFPSSSAQGFITRQRFGQLIKDLAVRAHVDPRKISPHTIRHAFATHLLNHGVDLLSLQKLLGHADIATTQIYTHILQEELVELVELCHPLSR